ncbi:hypothetical protein ACEPAG_9502 [Sanghuangporus baumii]
MGKFNPPSAYEPRPPDIHQHDNASQTPSPARQRSRDAWPSSPMRASRSPKEVAPAGQSSPGGTMRSRRAIVSSDLPENCQKETMVPGRIHPPSAPPTTHSLSLRSHMRGLFRSISTLLRGRVPQRAIQDRYPSIPESLDSYTGDTQVSPSNQQDTTDVSPISVTARHVREYGHSARAEALQTVGMLLKRIDQKKIDKEEARNVLFMTCIDMFARVSIIILVHPSSDRQLCTQDSFDNIAEISLAFQLFRVLVQEEILQGSDFIRAAITLCEEGHYDGCKLFIQLAVDDKKTDLTESEVEVLTNIASNLKLDRHEGKEEAA